MSIALVFPGQGSQIVGMGKDIYEQFAEARSVFEEVDESLGRNLTKIIFEGPSDKLTLTTNAQPALMAVSLAIFTVIKTQLNRPINKLCNMVAGHSLGEYSALCVSEAIDLRSTATILNARGTIMQEAAPLGTGGMVALIGASLSEAEELAAEVAQGEVCEVSNDNSVGQIVLSGARTALERLVTVAYKRDFRAIPITVTGPFHSSLMGKAAENLYFPLKDIPITVPKVSYISNVTARPVTDENQIRGLLIEQMCQRVRWRESIIFMVDSGINTFVEIGSGKVLSGLIKRINSEVKTVSINNLQSLNNYLEEMTIKL